MNTQKDAQTVANQQDGGQGGIAYASLRPSHFRSRCSRDNMGR